MHPPCVTHSATRWFILDASLANVNVDSSKALREWLRIAPSSASGWPTQKPALVEAENFEAADHFRLRTVLAATQNIVPNARQIETYSRTHGPKSRSGGSRADEDLQRG